MTPRSRSLTAVAVVATLAGAATSTASADAATSTTTKAARCAAKVAAAQRRTDTTGRYRVIARTSRLRVYGPPEKSRFGAYDYVCYLNTGALHRFGRSSSGTADSDRFVADVEARVGVIAYRFVSRGDKDTDRFVSLDARTGKTLADSGTVPDASGDQAHDDQLALLPKGVIAWANTTGVRYTDAKDDHVLADGKAGEPRKLSGKGSTVAWTQGGKRLSAKIPG